MKKNSFTLTFDSLPENESFARVVVSSFALNLNPTLEELSDIKTAISEAVTNCEVHAYRDKIGKIKLSGSIKDDVLTIEVADTGVGIVDISKAREPFFTTRPQDERSGMGFTVMESFMDNVEVLKNRPSGTIVKMTKRICQQNNFSKESENAFARANI